jgi:hypothetical protein
MILSFNDNCELRRQARFIAWRGRVVLPEPVLQPRGTLGAFAAA